MQSVPFQTGSKALTRWYPYLAIFLYISLKMSGASQAQACLFTTLSQWVCQIWQCLCETTSVKVWCDLHLCIRVIYNQPARCMAVPAAYTTDVYEDQCLYWASFKCVECYTWPLIFPCNILWLSVLLLCTRWWSFQPLSIQKFFLVTKNYIITISQYWDECSNPSTAILFWNRILFRSIHSPPVSRKIEKQKQITEVIFSKIHIFQL